ncbi:MAG: hypothetical protein ACTHJG_04570 [Rhodanobacteraceae bacterium]
MSDEGTFEITIDFTPGEGDPARVFKAMSGLIEAMTSLDSHLASSFDVSIDASLVLDRVEAGSVKGIFRDIIAGIPDEAIKDVEWKKIFGHYLLRAKYVMLKWLEETPKISHRDDVRVLEGDLLLAAEQTDLKQLPAYAPPRTELLLSDVHAIRESLDILAESDTASYSQAGETIKFNRELEISTEIIREVLTKEVVKASSKRIVKVKKPDYLGQSMWGFQYDGRAIDAKVADSDWLVKFQARQVDVRPGDSLSVLLYEEISYGYDGEVVHRYYEIERVDEILHPPTQNAINF